MDVGFNKVLLILIVIKVVFVHSTCPPIVTSNWTYFGTTDKNVCGNLFSTCPKENVSLEIGEMAYAECVVKTDVIRTEYCVLDDNHMNCTELLTTFKQCQPIHRINVIFYKPQDNDTALYFYIPGATDVNDNTNIKCIAQNDPFSSNPTDVDSRTVYFRVTTKSSTPNIVSDISLVVSMITMVLYSI